MNKINLKGTYTVVCTDANGNKKWDAVAGNLIVDEGLDHLLDNGVSAPLYVFLKGSGDAVPADTLASHASWSETTGYSGTRKAWTHDGADLAVVTNSNDRAVFNITGTATIDGAGLSSVASGTAGVLISASSFIGGPKSVESADTLTVTYLIQGAG